MFFKRAIAGVLTVMMLVGVMVLAGCGGGADVSGHGLVGTWEMDGAPDFTYEFRADGTGTRGITGMTETFTWSIPGDGRVNMRRDEAARGEIRNEQWDYNLSGDAVSFTSRQDANLGQFNFRRAGTGAPDVPDVVETTEEGQIDIALVGTWAWEQDPDYEYNFTEYGTGTRGMPGETENFNWFIPAPGQVTMNVAGVAEQWDYVIDGDVVTFTSRQVADWEFSYVRVAD